MMFLNWFWNSLFTQRFPSHRYRSTSGFKLPRESLRILAIAVDTRLLNSCSVAASTSFVPCLNSVASNTISWAKIHQLLSAIQKWFTSFVAKHQNPWCVFWVLSAQNGKLWRIWNKYLPLTKAGISGVIQSTVGSFFGILPLLKKAWSV